MFLENKPRISSPTTWMYKATTNSAGRLFDVSPERFTMLAFPNSPFLRFLIRSKSTSNETDAKVLDLSAVGVESPSFLSHLTSSPCVYLCAPFLVFLISGLFPDIIVSPCRLVDRRLTLLDSVEPTCGRKF
jgi:hypothetical protein